MNDAVMADYSCGDWWPVTTACFFVMNLVISRPSHPALSCVHVHSIVRTYVVLVHTWTQSIVAYLMKVSNEKPPVATLDPPSRVKSVRYLVSVDCSMSIC